MNGQEVAAQDDRQPRTRPVGRLVLGGPRTPERALLGAAQIGVPGTERLVDLDDLLAKDERLNLTAVAWRAARTWYSGQSPELAALGWLGEYRVAQHVLGVLRVVASVRKIELDHAACRWVIPPAAGPLLRLAMRLCGFEVAAGGSDSNEGGGVGRSRWLVKALARPWRLPDEWLVLPGGGVNELLLRPGRGRLPVAFLRQRVPPRRVQAALAFRYSIVGQPNIGRDLSGSLKEVVGGHLLPDALLPVTLEDLASAIAVRALEASLGELVTALHAAWAALRWCESGGAGLLTPDDAIPLTRAVVGVAALSGRPAVVAQHGAIIARDDQSHHVAGSSLTWGEPFLRVLETEMGERHRPWVMGFPGRMPIRHRDPNRDVVLFVGSGGHDITLATRQRHQVDLLNALARGLESLGRPVELVIRPHYADDERLHVDSRMESVRVRVARVGALSDALRGVAVMVTSVSTAIVEAALSGVPVVACPENMTDLVAGMRGTPGVYWAASGSDAAGAVCRVLRGAPLEAACVEGAPVYAVEFVGWPRLREHLLELSPEPSDAHAVPHSRILAQLMGA